MEKILIIEDNTMVVKSLQFKLKKDGYDVSVAEDGREALRLIKETTFNLVLTDLNLPFVTGNEIIAYLKENQPEIPIIVLSTSTQEDIIMNAFNMGVEDFITKPFSPNELSLRVRRLLSK
ncbi:response regulator transcription factor [Zunongwangia sp.]|uniref:response regulator transcription factor n=1 Tax=Zunongwangia sp. TaxID=1965325 RepID=UPI003AA97ABC